MKIKKNTRNKILIPEEIKIKIIDLFLNTNHNTGPNIAKKLDIKVCTVNLVISNYFKNKIKS